MIRNVVFFYPQRDDPRKICSCRSFRFFSFDKFSLSMRVRCTSEKLELLFFIEHSAPVLHSHTYTHTHAHKRNIKKEKRENGEKSGKNRKRQNERRRSLGKFFAFVVKWRHIYIRRKKLETKWNEREDDCWKKSFRTRYEIMKYWRKRGKNGKNGKLRDKRENNCWKKLYVRCKISVHFLVKKDLILLL